MIRNTHQAGYLAVFVLVFGAIFFLIFSALMGYVITQKNIQTHKNLEARSFAIAEAGLNYYKWYLAHNPEDVTNGTGVPGPYVRDYKDPEGNTIGSYSLSISSNQSCGQTTSVDITSTGSTADDPSVTRTVYARYAKPTVAEYAYIVNDNVWAGPDRTIVGPYHSNGVVRMDGTNNSVVSSGQENWVCDGSIPCDPYNVGDTVPGVYGDGPNSDLWQTAAPPISFQGLTIDLANMKSKAQSEGLYFDHSGDYGYIVEFLPDNTFNLSRVTRIRSYAGYAPERGWRTERNVIQQTEPVAGSPFTIPADCGLIYIEDKVWLKGQVASKVTLAAADVDTVGVDPTLILDDNITYANDNAGLLAIAEDDVLIGLDVPDDMELNGIFIAQNGSFGRNHYDSRLPGVLDSYRYRNSLTINGTIVSNGRVGTKWTCAGWCSGFGARYNYYDRNLVNDPPPLTPSVSDSYQFIEWREQD